MAYPSGQRQSWSALVELRSRLEREIATLESELTSQCRASPDACSAAQLDSRLIALYDLLALKDPEYAGRVGVTELQVSERGIAFALNARRYRLSKSEIAAAPMTDDDPDPRCVRLSLFDAQTGAVLYEITAAVEPWYRDLLVPRRSSACTPGPWMVDLVEASARLSTSSEPPGVALSADTIKSGGR